jgi:hypothetical protein
VFHLSMVNCELCFAIGSSSSCSVSCYYLVLLSFASKQQQGWTFVYGFAIASTAWLLCSLAKASIFSLVSTALFCFVKCACELRWLLNLVWTMLFNCNDLWNVFAFANYHLSSVQCEMSVNCIACVNGLCPCCVNISGFSWWFVLVVFKSNLCELI